MSAQKDYTVTMGGWYQRTTLHLSEVYGFFAEGFSKLNLSKEKLSELRHNLKLEDVSREAGFLEYVKAETVDGIQIKYYEDGLYMLSLNSANISSAKEILDHYYKHSFEPAIAYLFSLGAPTPKVLANIKTIHPTVVSVITHKPEQLEIDSQIFGSVYNKISSGNLTVFKTTDYIFIVTGEKEKRIVQDLVEMQIFFREFKDQLEKYLNIHRKIWEEISETKEKEFIKGKEVEDVRTKLDGYQKTINLIDSRINQMGSYVHTRASISKKLKIEEYLINLFQYKFEVLSDTQEYIKEVWQMTNDYLSSAISVVKDIEDRSVNTSIKSLRIISSIGVISGILGYLAQDRLPSVSSIGLIYFTLLIIVIWPINYLISLFYKNQKYKLNFTERAKNI